MLRYLAPHLTIAVLLAIVASIGYGTESRSIPFIY